MTKEQLDLLIKYINNRANIAALTGKESTALVDGMHEVMFDALDKLEDSVEEDGEQA